MFSYRDTYYPNTAALGTLYIPYLEAAAARDEEQQRKFAEASEAEGSRMDKLNRQSTVQTLTQNQADREAGGMGMSLAAATRLSTLGGQSSTDELSFQPSGAGSLVSAGGSATALSVVPISASPPAASASGRWNASGAGAFSLPTTGRPLSSRHTIGGMAPAMQRGGVGAQSLMSTLSEEDFQPNPMHSRSYSLGGGGAGEAQAHRAAQTWQQLAKTLKQDSQTNNTHRPPSHLCRVSASCSDPVLCVFVCLFSVRRWFHSVCCVEWRERLRDERRSAARTQLGASSQENHHDSTCKWDRRQQQQQQRRASSRSSPQQRGRPDAAQSRV